MLNELPNEPDQSHSLSSPSNVSLSHSQVQTTQTLPPRNPAPHDAHSMLDPPMPMAISTRPAGNMITEAQRREVDTPIDWSWLHSSENTASYPLMAQSGLGIEPSEWLWHHSSENPTAIDLVTPTHPDSSILPEPLTTQTGLVPSREPAYSYAQSTTQPGPRSVPSSGPPEKSVERRGIEEWMPWSTLMRILQAYHKHLYPLLPVMHWPTFLQLLMSREDERNQTWRAYLLSLVAYSIIQLPRSALSFLDVPTLRKLHRTCHAASAALQNRTYTVVNTTDIACDHIYLSTLGRTSAANVALSKAIRLAQQLKIHDEETAGVQPDRVELEVRRRMFWLLYGSDRTISALTSAPLQWNDADLRVSLPSAIDDNLITASGAFPQPSNVPSILSGFHHVSRLFRLLGSILTAHRSVSARQTTIVADPCALSPYLNTTVRPASDFRDALRQLLAELPPPLQLTSSAESSRQGTTETERDGFSRHGSSAFETCRANLLVSQAMVRFAVRQYAAAVGEREDGLEDKAWVEKHVLSMLEHMLSDSLAANGESLRNKVLYIASNLIDKYPDLGEGDTYISGLLSMFTCIREQQQASLLESTESARPSRAPTPGPL
ncbi:hypothetical protein I317_06446 [Kwoniella heveanensis CBS 569]|nr:hypothetical protein I317_06446 [Kwoniella heveanensis CBS 569]